MIIRRRSIEQIVEDQMKKWAFERKEPSQNTSAITMITVSRDPGSGGKIIAKAIAECLNFDLFHQEVIHEMAKSAKVNSRMLESLDEKGLSMLDDWISAVVHRGYLWPDEYLQHLLKVIGTIGEHGNAVLIGRGANFALPAKTTFRLRVIAPRDFRTQKVSEEFDLPIDEAHRRILKTESDRRAFVRKYFHADIESPEHYDIVVNTGILSLEQVIKGVRKIIQSKKE